MTSLIGTSKRALNLSLNYQIVISRPAPSSKNLAYDFSDSAAGKMVSPKTLRQEYNIKRDEFRRRQFVLDSQIRLVDGSKMDLSQVKPQKLKSQPKQDAKLEAQIVIKQQRYQEKIFSEIIRILISGVLSVEIFRNPVWRLTRLVPNKDMRGYTVYWIIDNEDDVSIFQEKLARKFEETQGLVRYHLGKALASKFSPKLTFKYEDYEPLSSVIG